MPLHHVDLYRIEGLDDMDELGLDELVEGGGVVVVEWAEKAAELFPAGRLQVNIERRADDSRRLVLSSTSAEYDRFLDLVDVFGPLGRAPISWTGSTQALTLPLRRPLSNSIRREAQ